MNTCQQKEEKNQKKGFPLSYRDFFYFTHATGNRLAFARSELCGSHTEYQFQNA